MTDFVLICVLVLLVLGFVLAMGHRRSGEAPVVAPKGDCATCDGTPQAKCEQECMMEAAVRSVEYFDDEELDTYRGRPSDAYTDDEAEQFRDVMLTMRQEEVPAWGRSLNLRGVSLPDQVKDDYILLAGERANDSRE